MFIHMISCDMLRMMTNKVYDSISLRQCQMTNEQTILSPKTQFVLQVIKSNMVQNLKHERLLVRHLQCLLRNIPVGSRIYVPSVVSNVRVKPA